MHRSRKGTWVLLAVAPLASVGCSGAETASEATAERSAIVGGSGEQRPGSDAVVFITGGCSGVLVSPYAVLTVEHCLSLPPPQPGENASTSVSLEIRGGKNGETCLTPNDDGACGRRQLDIIRQGSNDLVVLRSQSRLAYDGPTTALPLIPRRGKPTAAFTHGYGVSSASGDLLFGARLSAEVNLKQHSDDYIYGRTAPGVRVCGGDSGGPLMTSLADGTPLLLGVLSATQYDPSSPQCTAEGGLNRWARADLNFLSSELGCVADRANTLNCRETGIQARAMRRPQRPGIRAALEQAGAQFVDPKSVTTQQITEQGIVGTMTEDGPALVRLPKSLRSTLTSSAAKELDGGVGIAGGGQNGEYVPLSPRGLALSGNGDQRTRLFVIQGGGIYSSYSTGAPGCEGTLIGSRVVRTAMHCVRSVNQPYFTARYDGGTTTWTFDGGATWVTFNPRQADFYFYGGNYYNFGCQDGRATGQCIAQDWALLIMAQNVWQPVHVVPSYMGFTTASAGAVTNAGYPSCSDISSPNIQNCQTGLMYGMDCSVVVNNTSYYYSNCDVSPGHSGSGTFKTTNGSRYLIGSHKGGPSNSGCSNGTCQAYDCGTDSWLRDFQSQQRTDYSAVTLW